MGQGADYLNRLMVAFRPAGGEFGPVKPIGDPPTDWAYVTDIDIGGDGTLAIGLVQDHDPVVWVRSPSGRWSGPIELAHDGLDAPPEVEVDGSGTVVAAVVRPLNEGDWPDTGPLDITLIDADGSIVTQPLNRWMEVDSANGFDLQVSNLGEIIVVGEVTAPYVTDEFETRQMVGIWGVFGNSKRHRIGDPMAMTAPGSRSPSLSMNPRGDAVMIWEEALRLHSYRRAPGGSFERPVGIPPTPVPSGEGLAWPHPAGVGVDELGNASVLWTEWNPLMRWYMGDDGPPLTEAPEASPIGQELPPVLAHPYTEYSPVPIPVEEPFVPWTPPYREPRPPKIDPNDHEPPEVVLWTIPRVTQKGIQLKARCNERCEVHLRARIDAPFRLKPVRKVLGENRIGQVTLVAPGDASALAKAADAESRLRIRGTVTDEAGNSRAVHAHTRLVPPDEIHSKP